jgi:hypothetical protein
VVVHITFFFLTDGFSIGEKQSVFKWRSTQSEVRIDTIIVHPSASLSRLSIINSKGKTNCDLSIFNVVAYQILSFNNESNWKRRFFTLPVKSPLTGQSIVDLSYQSVNR